jgi:S-adenosylmethionine synthetase
MRTAAYGHGTYARNGNKNFSAPGGLTKTVEVELFWEKLDFVDQVKLLLDCIKSYL